MLLRPSKDFPAAAGGLRVSLPVVLVLHGAAVLGLLHASASLDRAGIPTGPEAAHTVRFFAPPAAALPVGEPDAPRRPETAAAPRRRPQVFLPPPEPVPTAALQAAAEAAADAGASFGAPDGLPEGLFDGLPFGRAEGVVGGLAGGVAGGRIGASRAEADPVLPPPDTPPTPISMPSPQFPRAALRDGIRGRVVLRALITERGAVEVLRVIRSVPGLDEEAVRVVESGWRFRPAQRNGRPVAALSDLTVRFSLR